MKLLKICIGTWENASRDERELSVCSELGMDVSVLAKGEENDKGREDEIDGFRVFRYTTRPVKKASVKLNRIISIFQWAGFVRKYSPDIISGHDIEGLTIAWISTWFIPRKKRPKLVYDSHEFELGRYSGRGFVKWNIVRLFERHLINKCLFSMMVNKSISDEVARIHHLKNTPIVVRNIPNNWQIDENICRENRLKILSELKPEGRMLLMYHGVVSRDRGVDILLQIVSRMPHVRLALIGQLPDDEFRWLNDEIRRLRIEDRIYIRDVVPIDELWKYVGAADVGMITIPPVTRSYYYCLPNKLFENIQALTPVIVSDLPEMRSIVTKYKIGWVCNESVESIETCLQSIIDCPEKLNEKHVNLLKAKDELCWEKEKRILIDAYKSIMTEN